MTAKGLCQRCYDRRRNPGRQAARSAARKDRYATDPNYRQRQSDRARRNNTGMTPEQTLQLRSLQAGLCGICGCEMDTENKKSAAGECADHCHATGRVRGLLCKTCNQSLGFYEKHKQAAEKYLDTPPASLLD